MKFIIAFLIGTTLFTMIKSAPLENLVENCVAFKDLEKQAEAMVRRTPIEDVENLKVTPVKPVDDVIDEY